MYHAAATQPSTTAVLPKMSLMQNLSDKLGKVEKHPGYYPQEVSRELSLVAPEMYAGFASPTPS